MIVLHIGMPKAGSTTIQTFLTNNRDALRGVSVDYPIAGRREYKMHQYIVDELNEKNKKQPSRENELCDLAKEIADSKCDISVLSAEMFSRLSKGRIEKLYQVMSDVSQDFKIILVLRDLITQLPSSYGQKIRYGKDDFDFDTFFATRISKWWINPFIVAKQWAEVFGWDLMHVRLCDSRYLLNGDLIDDFVASLGLDAEGPEIRALPRQERVNESSGWKTLEAGRAMLSGRHGLPAGHPLVKALSATRVGTEGRRRMSEVKNIVATGAEIAQELGWAADKGRYLTRAQAKACADVFGDAIRDLNACLLVKLPKSVDLELCDFAEREFLPDARHIPGDELASFYDELGARLTGGA